MQVERCDAGAASPFLREVPGRCEVLQWHGAEVQRLPPGGQALMRSPRCAVQAMSVGPRAFSMQFHVEITAHTVPEWRAIPAYASALAQSLGPDGARTLEQDARERLPAFNALARQIYGNWRAACGL